MSRSEYSPEDVIMAQKKKNQKIYNATRKRKLKACKGDPTQFKLMRVAINRSKRTYYKKQQLKNPRGLMNRHKKVVKSVSVDYKLLERIEENGDILENYPEDWRDVEELAVLQKTMKFLFPKNTSQTLCLKTSVTESIQVEIFIGKSYECCIVSNETKTIYIDDYYARKFYDLYGGNDTITFVNFARESPKSGNAIDFSGYSLKTKNEYMKKKFGYSFQELELKN